MRCGKCKHWQVPEIRLGWQGDFGFCKQTPHGEVVGVWGLSMGSQKWDVAPEYADRTAVVTDASAYNAELHTKAEHFCAMFAAAK